MKLDSFSQMYCKINGREIYIVNFTRISDAVLGLIKLFFFLLLNLDERYINRFTHL